MSKQLMTKSVSRCRWSRAIVLTGIIVLLAVFAGVAAPADDPLSSDSHGMGLDSSPGEQTSPVETVEVSSSDGVAVQSQNRTTKENDTVSPQSDGWVEVDVDEAADGATATEINSLVVYRNPDQWNVVKTIENYPSLDIPYLIKGLEPGGEYLVEAYSQDMYIGNTGWMDIVEYDYKEKTLTAQSREPVSVTAYYEDGETPLEGATLRVESHEGVKWRDPTTDSNGEAEAWLRPHIIDRSNTYYNVEVVHDGTTHCSWQLDSLSSSKSFSCTTDTSLPPGDLDVSVEESDGSTADEVNSLVIYQDSWDNQYDIVENYPSVSLPQVFSDLPSDHEYLVSAYSMDMYAGDTGWVSIGSNDAKSRTISAPSRNPVTVQVYHDDGETPLEGATVEVQSHEGELWREQTTDSNGEVEPWLRPHITDSSETYYDIEVSYDGTTHCTYRLDSLSSSTSLSCTTGVASPPGDLDVTVEETDGSEATEVNGLVIYQDSWDNQYDIVENYPSVSLPQVFSDLPSGHEYLVEAYSMDMYVGDTGWVSIGSNDAKSRTVTANSRNSVTVEAYYGDGETPLEGATVEVRSQEGVMWRDPVTDSNGEATAWVRPPGSSTSEYYDVEVSYDGTTHCTYKLESLSSGTTLSCTTGVDAPPGDLDVSVEESDGSTATEVNSLVIYQDSWDNQYDIVENYPSVSLPQVFSDLPSGHEYLVSAYSMDMYAGDTGWVTIGSNEAKSRTISAPSRETVSVDVYRADGETPLEGAELKVKSHEGELWRDMVTDSNGEAEAWLRPHVVDETSTYYDVEVVYEGVSHCSWQLDSLSDSKTFSCTTDVAAAPGDFELSVAESDGSTATEVNGLVIYQDSWDNQYDIVENYPSVDLPKLLADLPSGHKYLVSAYSMDTYIDDTGWVEISGGETVSETLSAPSRVPVATQVYAADGETPLEGAELRVESSEGVVWRDPATDGNGFAEAWLRPHTASNASEYYDVSVVYEGETRCSWQLDSLSSTQSFTCLTEVETPPADLSVTVTEEDGSVASEVNSLVIYQDSWDNQYAVVEEYPTVDQPYTFEDLPADHEYLVEAYSQDNYIGDTGWLTLDAGSKTSETLRAPAHETVTAEVYYSDGETPLSGAELTVESQEGVLWRSLETDASGEATAWLRPHTLDSTEEYYDIAVSYDGTTECTWQRDQLDSPVTLSCTTDVAPPPGDLTVNVTDGDGSTADEINSLVVYQDSWENRYATVENYPSVDLPQVFEDLPAGHDYLVSAYSMDMYTDDTGWISIDSGESATATLSPREYVPIEFEVLAADGETPLSDAHVAVDSHATVDEEFAWRSDWTGDDGQTRDLWLRSSASGTESEFYDVTVTYEGNAVGTDQIDQPAAETRTIQTDVTVEQEVTADLEYGPTLPEPGTEVTFDAGTSRGDSLEYEWQIEGGPTETGDSITHTFEEPGEYEVVLTVQNQWDSDTTRTTVTVSDGLTFSVDPSTPSAGESVFFEASGADQYEWTFGDGSESVTGERVSHTYTEAGTYEVTVSDGETTKSRETSVESGSLQITGIEREHGGVPLQNTTYDETFEAEIETDGVTVDSVEFVLGDRANVVRDGSDGWNTSFDIGTLTTDRLLTVTAYGADGTTATAETYVPVQELPGWAEWLVDNADTSADEDEQQIEVMYRPFTLEYGFDVGDIPVDLETQTFDGLPEAGFTYDAAERGMVLSASGGIDTELFGYGLEASVGVDGTIDRHLEFAGADVQADAGIPIQVGPPLKVNPPVVDPIGVETQVTPGVTAEGSFDAQFEFQDGTITPAVELEASAETPVPNGTVGVSATGELDGSFDVGTDDPNLRGSASVEGNGWVKTYLWQSSFTVGPYETTIGSDTSALTAETSDVEWTPQSKEGSTPLEAFPTVDDQPTVQPQEVTSLSGTAVDSLVRLTQRDIEDTQPALAVTGDEQVVAWSRQHADKAVEQGRDIAVRTRSNGDWSELTWVTDDDTHHGSPVLAANNGSVLAAWATLNESVADAGLESPDEAFPYVEIAYSVYDGSSWTEPVTLTETEVREHRPAVAPSDDGWLLAWEADYGGTSDLRYTEIGPDGSEEETERLSGATNPAAGPAAEGATIAYSSLDDDGMVAAAQVVNGDIVDQRAYDADDVYDIAVAGDRLVWAQGQQTDPALFDASAGERPKRLTLRENASGISELSLTVDGTDTVLSYRARLDAETPRDIIYRLDRGDGWIQDRPIASPDDDGLVVHRPVTTFAADGTAFTTAFAAKEPGVEAKSDVFVTTHDFEPDFELDGSVEQAAAGSATSLSYDLTNVGDIAAGGELTVVISNGETTTTRSYDSLSAGESVSETVTVPVDASGSFEVWLETETTTTPVESIELVAATPALSPAGVEVVGPVDGGVELAVQVANDGNATAQSVPVVLEDGGTVRWSGEVGPVGPGEVANVSAVVDPAALDSSVIETVRLDPEGTLPPGAVKRESEQTWLVQPDLTVADLSVSADGESAEVTVSNRGLTAANATVRVVNATTGETVGTDDVSLPASGPDGTVFETVPVAVDIADGDTVRVVAESAVPDADPSTAGLEERVTVLDPAITTHLQVDDATGRPGANVTVDLSVADGVGIESYTTTVLFDPEVVSFVSATGVDFPDPAVAGESYPGELSLKSNGSTAVDDPTLARLTFEVVGAEGDETTLSFVDLETTLESAQPIDSLSLDEGTITVDEELQGSLSMSDQNTTRDNQTVLVDEVAANAETVVALYDEGYNGSVGDRIGTSDTLSAGTHANLVIEPDEPLAETQTVTARLHHVDDGGSVGSPIEVDGAPVQNRSTVIVPEAESPPPVVGESPPQDLNGDGLYRDVTGDGELDIFDVQALYTNLDDEAVQSHPAAFNFAGRDPEDADIFDVQALFEDAYARTH